MWQTAGTAAGTRLRAARLLLQRCSAVRPAVAAANAAPQRWLMRSEQASNDAHWQQQPPRSTAAVAVAASRRFASKTSPPASASSASPASPETPAPPGPEDAEGAAANTSTATQAAGLQLPAAAQHPALPATLQSSAELLSAIQVFKATDVSLFLFTPPVCTGDPEQSPNAQARNLPHSTPPSPTPPPNSPPHSPSLPPRNLQRVFRTSPLRSPATGT